MPRYVLCLPKLELQESYYCCKDVLIMDEDALTLFNSSEGSVKHKIEENTKKFRGLAYWKNDVIVTSEKNDQVINLILIKLGQGIDK